MCLSLSLSRSLSLSPSLSLSLFFSPYIPTIFPFPLLSIPLGVDDGQMVIFEIMDGDLMATSAFGYIFATVALPVGELFRGTDVLRFPFCFIFCTRHFFLITFVFFSFLQTESL
jgi:hypothetical protein